MRVRLRRHRRRQAAVSGVLVIDCDALFGDSWRWSVIDLIRLSRVVALE
jgi:hypothetical protein